MGQRIPWRQYGFIVTIAGVPCARAAWKKFNIKNVKNPKYDCCSCLGGPGGPFAESKVPVSVSELRPHHNGDICATRKMTSSSYMGHNVKKRKKNLGGPGNAWGRTSIIGLGLSLCASIISFMLIYMSNMEAI